MLLGSSVSQIHFLTFFTMLAASGGTRDDIAQTDFFTMISSLADDDIAQTDEIAAAYSVRLGTLDIPPLQLRLVAAYFARISRSSQPRVIRPVVSYITPFGGDLVQLQQQLQQFVGTSLPAETTITVNSGEVALAVPWPCLREELASEVGRENILAVCEALVRSVLPHHPRYFEPTLWVQVCRVQADGEDGADGEDRADGGRADGDDGADGEDRATPL